MDTAQNFSLTGNDRPIEEIITKLKFLSKIRAGEKLNVKAMFVRDNSSVYQRFLRTLALEGESKDETLTFIKTIINEAVDLICVYRRNSNAFNQNIAALIIENLESAKEGLCSLSETYAYDNLFVSRIEAVMATLDARIRSLGSGAEVPTLDSSPVTSYSNAMDMNNDLGTSELMRRLDSEPERKSSRRRKGGD